MTQRRDLFIYLLAFFILCISYILREADTSLKDKTLSKVFYPLLKRDLLFR